MGMPQQRVSRESVSKYNRVSKKPPRIKFVPRYDGAIHGRAVNLVRKFYPQLCGLWTFDELMQESYIKFHQLRQQTINGTLTDINSAKWFMSVYQFSLERHLLSLLDRAAKHLARYSYVQDIQLLDQMSFSQAGLGVDDAAYVQKVIEQVLVNPPAEIEECFTLVMEHKDKMERTAKEQKYETALNRLGSYIRAVTFVNSLKGERQCQQ